MFKRFTINTLGRDFAVGDIHGCFTRLQSTLDEIGFDPDVDRLFAAGDLVDRGPESEQSLAWLDKPWFHSVRGNHDQMAIDHVAGKEDAAWYFDNGGAWMIAKIRSEAQPFADAFAQLPIAIEIETSEGMVGIVHADCPTADWSTLRQVLTDHANDLRTKAVIEACMWDRSRFNDARTDRVAGIDLVIVGHSGVDQPCMLGNTLYIDTGAVFAGGHFSIVQFSKLTQ